MHGRMVISSPINGVQCYPKENVFILWLWNCDDIIIAIIIIIIIIIISFSKTLLL